MVSDATLDRWNWAMAVFHTLFACTTLILGKTDLTLQVYTTTLAFEPPTNASGFRLVPSYSAFGDLYLTQLCALFFLLSAVFHLGNALFWRRSYLAQLERKRTPYRWVEYSLSAPVMALSIAYTTGMRDATSLFYMFVLISSTMTFGWLHELLNEPSEGADEWRRPLRERVAAHLLGYYPQLAAWGGMWFLFFSNTSECRGPPDFVYVIVFAQAALFFSFGASQALVTVWPPSRFRTGELIYMVLSLVAKGLLGVVLLSNVLILGSFEEAVAPSGAANGAANGTAANGTAGC